VVFPTVFLIFPLHFPHDYLILWALCFPVFLSILASGVITSGILLHFNEMRGGGMRKEFEMSEGDLREILDACKPVPYMIFGGMVPRSPQENANDAWGRLGEKMGFDWKTVRSNGKGNRYFTAEVKKRPLG